MYGVLIAVCLYVRNPTTYLPMPFFCECMHTGKTTFLGQLSLDFAEGGVNTLWGSFEIKNTRLMHKLLQQYSRGPMPEDKMKKAQALEVLADRFENLPLYIMTFHGGSNIDDVLDAMEYAAYVHDVEHIILDNMQFMISRNSSTCIFLSQTFACFASPNQSCRVFCAL